MLNAVPGGLLVALAVSAVVAAAIILVGSKTRSVGRVARSAGANAVPVFYCGTMAVFLVSFDARILKHCEPILGSMQMRWIRFSYSFPFLSFAKLYFSDPGFITRKTWAHEYARFPFDQVSYLPNNECRTCLFAKPARSKHCSVCKRCVAMQDHHCVWVNNCIGLANFKWFASFLVVNVYVFGYGWFILAAVSSKSWTSAWQTCHHWWQIIFAFTSQGEPQRLAVCLWLLCTFLLPLVVSFTFFHLSYVWAGVTTNEADKWIDIKDLIPTRQLYYVPDTQIVLLKRPDGTFNRNMSESERESPLKVVENERESPNSYDRGFLENLRLLLTNVH